MWCALPSWSLIHPLRPRSRNSATIESPSSNLMATLAAHFVVAGTRLSVPRTGSPSSIPRRLPSLVGRERREGPHRRRSLQTDTRSFLALVTSSVSGTVTPKPIDSVFPVLSRRPTKALAASSCAVTAVAVVSSVHLSAHSS